MFFYVLRRRVLELVWRQNGTEVLFFLKKVIEVYFIHVKGQFCKKQSKV